jgi:voltage-gated sodium channel
LFGNDYPEFFGDLGSSMFTLFQEMTLDVWSDQIARQMLSDYPLSWLYYLSFIIITAVVVLNIVVGIVVESVNRMSRMEKMRKKKINNDLRQDVLVELEQIRIHLESIEHRLMRK